MSLGFSVEGREASDPERDSYGGVLALQASGATGSFHLEEINGRSYRITPENYGSVALGINPFHTMTRADDDAKLKAVHEEAPNRADADPGKVFQVTRGETSFGRLEVHPELPGNGKVPAGTVLELEAIPDPGYVVDSVFYAVETKGGGRRYFESMTSRFRVRVNRDVEVGAWFIPVTGVKGFRVLQDVVYAQPGVKALKYDAYVPDGAKDLPGIVIIHGGGWSSNNEDIMRGQARELVRSGDYVVFSIDYRWMNRGDGDAEPNTMPDLIEDVFGAIAHIREHADDYGLDAGRIAVTGDSAGGHLAAVAAIMPHRIGSGGFGLREGVFEFRPSYLPPGQSIEQVRDELSRSIRAAAPSYGVFGAGPMLRNKMKDKPEGWWKAIAPIENIPDAGDRVVPHFLLRGTKDWIKHEHVQSYANALKAAGHPVEYEQLEGARHAFLDWKPSARHQATFEKFAVPAIRKMKAFLDGVFREQ
jgi:acetyl esterase